MTRLRAQTNFPSCFPAAWNKTGNPSGLAGYRMTDWLTYLYRLTDWPLTDWLNDQLTDWLNDEWLLGWLATTCVTDSRTCVTDSRTCLTIDLCLQHTSGYNPDQNHVEHSCRMLCFDHQSFLTCKKRQVLPLPRNVVREERWCWGVVQHCKVSHTHFGQDRSSPESWYDIGY